MKNKKILYFAASFILVTVLAFSIHKLVSYRTSELYSKDTIQSAVEIVKSKFNEFDGCIPLSFYYAGDNTSAKEATNRDYEKIIVIKVIFISPLKAKGAFEPHSLYRWLFILGCNSEDDWQIIDYGY